MWFAKFFGGRSEAGDEEPARVAPTISAPTPQARPPHQQQVQSRSGVAPVKASQTKSAARAAKQVKGGFDPYNSGTFDAGNAWEHVIRR